MIALQKYGAILPLILVAALAGCTQRAQNVPPNLAVKAKQVLTVQATGDQVYTWDATAKTWKFSGPEATFAGQGVTGKHSKGPTWQAQDGSSVVGKMTEQSPSPRNDSVPWLLLEATTHTGTGVLSRVTYIQRLDTLGGKAPPEPGTQDGQMARVHYTATYVFYSNP